MTMRNIRAAFESRVDAESARQQVIGVGVPASEVHILERGSQSEQADGGAPEHQGVWAHIKQMFLLDEDRTTSEESLRRDGFVLTAAVDDDLAGEAIEALESSKAVDLEERETEWRVKDWTGDSQSADGLIAGVVEPLRVGKREADRGGTRVRSFIAAEPTAQSAETVRYTEVESDDTGDGSGASRSARGDAGKDI